MNQKVLGTIRFVAYVALFSAIHGVLAYLGTVSWLNGIIAVIVTGSGAAWEHALADKLGYNLPVGKVAVSK